MVMRRCPHGEGAEAAEQVQLLAAEQRDVGHGLRPRQDGQQAKQENLVQRILNLPALAWIVQIPEMAQENDGLFESRPVAGDDTHGLSPACESRPDIDSRVSSLVTFGVHPITLHLGQAGLELPNGHGHGETPLIMSGRMVFVFPIEPRRRT